jgi:hypothetical protein
MDLREFRGGKDHLRQEFKVSRVSRDSKGGKDQMVLKASRVCKDLKVFKELRDGRV